MFNDNGSPVSLFSFQDIITGLTGIMIFFLLLLSLNILEMSSQETGLSSAEKELTLIREQNQISRKHIKEISEDISSCRTRIRTVSSKDETELEIDCFNQQKQLKKQKKLLEKIKRELIAEKKQLNQVKNKSQELSDKSAEIEKQLVQNNIMADEIKEKKRKVQEIRKAINQKKSSVSITIASDIKKHPVLVECSSSEIRVYDKVANTKFIATRSTSMASQLVDEVMEKLNSFPKDKYYFVFLVKPSSVNYISYLTSRFQSEMKNAVWGMEPVYETEGIGHE